MCKKFMLLLCFATLCSSCAVNTMQPKASVTAKIEKQGSNESENVIKIGEKFTLDSKILNEKRSFWIHLPKSYNDKTIYPKRYPVLYLLDGESYFSLSSGVVDFMSEAGVSNNYQIPELIIVAITNNERDDRFRVYSPTKVKDYDEKSGGGDNFLRFIAEELVPDIEAKYRTIPLRILVGHSMGGLLTVYDFLHEPAIFNAHIAMDPSIWWDNKFLFKRAREIDLRNRSGTLYLSTYELAQRREEYREFIGIIDAIKSSKLRTKFQVFESQNHGSLPLLSLYNGLLFLFDGYKPPLDNFVSDPSLIGEHFNRISKNLGVLFLPPEDLIHAICTHTVIEKPQKAIECFKINVANYPGSFSAYAALAEAYEANGQKQKARSNYQKSLQLNPNNQKASEALKKLKEY